MTTNSGLFVNCSKYAFRVSVLTWLRTLWACFLNWSFFSISVSASIAWVKLLDGLFASTTTILSPGRWTTMSGRCDSPSVVLIVRWVSKSHRSVRPANSTTRFRCNSPQSPCACGRLSAPTNWLVSLLRLFEVWITRSSSLSSFPNASVRFLSYSINLSLTLVSWSLTGDTSSSIALVRFSRSSSERALICLTVDSASVFISSRDFFATSLLISLNWSSRCFFVLSRKSSFSAALFLCSSCVAVSLLNCSRMDCSSSNWLDASRNCSLACSSCWPVVASSVSISDFAFAIIKGSCLDENILVVMTPAKTPIAKSVIAMKGSIVVPAGYLVHLERNRSKYVRNADDLVYRER